MEALAKPRTDIAEIDSAIVESFKINLVEVAEMVAKYQTLTLPPADTQAYKICRAGLTSCVHTRTGINKRRLELNVDDQKRIKARNRAGEQLTALIAPAEDHLDRLVKVEDDRKAAIKAKKVQIEQDRIAGIQAKITSINNMVPSLGSLTVIQLNTVICDIFDLEITLDEYQEYATHAQQVKDDALEAAKSALIERTRLDQEVAQRKEESERLVKLRKEQEEEARRLEEVKAKQEAEAIRIQAEQDAEKAALKAKRLKLEQEIQVEQDRKDREERERKIKEEAQAQAIKDAETYRVQLELDLIAQEKVEAEEKARQEALKPDKEKLLDFAGVLEDLESPKVKDGKAKAVVAEATEALAFTAQTIRDEVEEL